MLYGIKWYDRFHREYKVVTGASIPDALHRGQMNHGMNFTVSGKEYGIMNVDNEFVRVRELDEPGKHRPEELEEILRLRYNGQG